MTVRDLHDSILTELLLKPMSAAELERQLSVPPQGVRLTAERPPTPYDISIAVLVLRASGWLIETHGILWVQRGEELPADARV